MRWWRSLSPKKAELSEDSQRRLETNPLRILDSKDPKDNEASRGAPPAHEYLSEKSRKHIERVQDLLKTASVPFNVDGALVRGFDYYTDTLWEVTAGGLGAQNAIGGGGRYDNLVEQLGGRATPGVGFGSGIERLLLALESQKVELKPDANKLIWLVSHGPEAKAKNWELMLQLRRAGFVCDMDPGDRSVKSQFKVADREKAAFCLTTGETELTAGTVEVKELTTGKRETVPRIAWQSICGSKRERGASAELDSRDRSGSARPSHSQKVDMAVPQIQYVPVDPGIRRRRVTLWIVRIAVVLASTP